MPISFGLNIWSRLIEKTFPYLDQTNTPFDSLWMPDHVQYKDNKVAEGWSLLAYAMARYPDKVCGHAVLCNSFRNPAQLAKMAATMQTLSGGKLVLGIGAGWNEEEYRAYGWPFPSAKVRIAQLAEAIDLIRTLWTDAPASYSGEHYQISGAYCEPRPNPLPPVMVGGSGEKYLLRVVAQKADWWNCIYSDRETYAHKQNVLREHCRVVGRNHDEIVQMTHNGILIAENEKELKRLQADPEVRPASAETLVGTTEQITERLLAAIDQGATYITTHFCDAPRPDGTLLFAQEVMPHLRNG
jgi:alkanesulfonate monooxygenase SsuD/methylene tetrahydromethanopterin reductase-like flavin-dependent oxidoreductase (luciferase family)